MNGTQSRPATGLANATVTFVAPSTPGTYNVRLFANNGYTRLAVSNTITVTAKPAPTITVLTPSVAPGGTVRFDIANGPANPTDWVGLHSTAAGDNAYLDWMFLNGTRVAPPQGLSNASLQFTAPTTPGTYNVRLFANNSYTRLAVSATITVAP